MTGPVISDDISLRNLIDSIAQVCLSREFISLFKELETAYMDLGDAGYREAAFKDAYYAIIQEGQDVWTPVPSANRTRLPRVNLVRD